MKKRLTSLVLLFSLFIFSQEYHFDRVLKYELNSARSNSIAYNVNWYLNTNDSSYYLSIKDFDDKQAKLVDIKNNLVHKFHIKSKMINGKKNYHFKYISSVEIPITSDESKSSIINVNLLNDDDNGREFLFKENFGSKYKLTLAYSDKDLFHAVSPLIFDRYVKPDELKFSKFYMIKSAEIIPQNSVSITFNLQGIENQEIDLKIDKLKIKKTKNF